MKLLILFLVLLIIQLDDVICPLASTWTYCNCRWLSWSVWSSCNEKCYGRRKRSRKVRITQKIGCTEFTDCASNGMGSEYDDCNQFCYNGGSHIGFLFFHPCRCVPGKYGRCCDKTVTCSSLSSPSNGRVFLYNKNYGSKATYTCNRDYNLTSGSRSRTCGDNGGWSGTSAVCRYVNTCSTKPCQNGGQCLNEIEDYTCQCEAGWTGKNCETDIQPPVMTVCPTDQNVTTKETKYNISWTVPQFSDPMGHNISITTNYPDGFVVVPWGDYVIQYVATKPFNGLRTECKFTFKVRPYPCPELNIPINGARVCNGWKTEYAGVCLVYCSEDFVLELNRDPRRFYVCGASGNWIPPGPLPDCSMPYVDINHLSGILSYHYNGTCQTNKQLIQESYINRLKDSNQRALCDKDPEECKPEKVAVDC